MDRHDCQNWLLAFLEDGPRPVRECQMRALEAGFTMSQLEWAKLASVVATRTPVGWTWEIRKPSFKPSPGASF